MVTPLPWFPDWSGKAVAIVGSGPSTASAGVEKLRHMPTLAIMNNIDLCPWAEVVYGCDAAWWNIRLGLPKYQGLRIAWKGDRDHAPPGFPETHIRRIDIDQKSDRLAMREAGTVGSGGNSGFQALNLALQFGARRILLVGIDCQGGGRTHWFGRHNGVGLRNPNETSFRRWAAAFDASVNDLKVWGAEVLNASPISAIKGFRKVTVDEALAQWNV